MSLDIFSIHAPYTHSHNELSEKGTNTHDQIDTAITASTNHIADSTLHFLEGAIDHDNILKNGANSHATLDTGLSNSVAHIATVAGNPHTVTKAEILAGNLIVNADVNAAAAIVNSKLNLANVAQSVSFEGADFVVKHNDDTNGDYIAKIGNNSRGLVFIRTHTLSEEDYASIMLVKQAAGWTIPGYPYGNYALYMSPNSVTFYGSTGVVVGTVGPGASGNMNILAQTGLDLELKLRDNAGARKVLLLDEDNLTVGSWDSDGQLTIYGGAATKLSIYNNDATPSEVFAVDNGGNLTLAGTVDGVDIAARDHAESHNAASHSDIASSGADIDSAVGLKHAESHLLPTHDNVILDIATPFCTAVGFTAGNALTGNSLRCTAFGYEALITNTTSNENTAVGWMALKLTTGASNTAVGSYCLQANAGGGNNVAVGQAALGLNTSASGNTALGAGACAAITTTGGACGVGYHALYAATEADNTAVGADALRFVVAGHSNVAVGSLAGYSLTSNDQNTFIGKDAGNHASQKVDVINSMALGYGTWTTADNQVVIGNASVTTMILRGAVTMSFANGDAFPGTPNHGETFYRNDLHKLYVYDSGLATPAWQEV